MVVCTTFQITNGWHLVLEMGKFRGKFLEGTIAAISTFHRQVKQLVYTSGKDTPVCF